MRRDYTLQRCPAVQYLLIRTRTGRGCPAEDRATTNTSVPRAMSRGVLSKYGVGHSAEGSVKASRISVPPSGRRAETSSEERPGTISGWMAHTRVSLTSLEVPFSVRDPCSGPRIDHQVRGRLRVGRGGEEYAERAPIDGRLARPPVVHIDDDAGACRQTIRHAVGQAHEGVPWRPASSHCPVLSRLKVAARTMTTVSGHELDSAHSTRDSGRDRSRPVFTASADFASIADWLQQEVSSPAHPAASGPRASWRVSPAAPWPRDRPR